MKKIWNRGFTLLVISGMAWASATAVAQDIYWATAVNGSFGDENRWNPEEVPEAGAWAIFDRAGDYTVTLHDSHVIGTFQVRTDAVTLDLAGHALFSMTNLYVAAEGIGAAGDPPLGLAGAVGTLNIRNTHATETSTVQVTGDFMVAGGNATESFGSIGVLDIAGPRTVVTSSTQALIGNASGAATVRVHDGAVWNHAGIRMWDQNPADAASTIFIENGGSMLGSAALELSWDQLSTIHVRSGGTLTSGTIVFSRRPGAGRLIVEGNGSTATTGQLSMGRRNAKDEVHVLDGGVLTATNLTMVVDAGYGTGSDQTVVVDGDGSKITLSGYVSVGGIATNPHPGSGSLTVRNGGEVAANGAYLYVHERGALALDDGTVTVAGYLTGYSGAAAGQEPEYRLTLHSGMQNESAPLAVTGNLTFGDLKLELSLAEGFSADVDDVFDILSFGGTRTGTFLGLADGALIVDTESGYEFEIGYGGASDDVVILTVIPEPGTLLLLFAGAGLLAARRRRG